MPREHPSPSDERGDVPPERVLAMAILLQARKDLASARDQIRADAAKFWRGDGTGLALWAEVLDLDVHQLQRVVQD